MYDCMIGICLDILLSAFPLTRRGEIVLDCLRSCRPIHAVEFSRKAANWSFYNKPGPTF